MIMNDTGELASVSGVAAESGSVRRQRTDIRTRDLINQAVASIPTLGLQRAAEFLATMNVPAEVAVRVLVYPNRRRAN
ncbi:hypothetical protein LK542_11640 [Massilia sp. IC2-477]|uniref:hypothetical protein n=1 Tax=Massilia sp. IC2-477 TaxID=2887198 RepID=UPI001D119F01|nr:hypothetical protein [Massilia sp. IC2-477]MCC2956268.1 hypothetical protein [Massilia sp. IC2-477]